MTQEIKDKIEAEVNKVHTFVWPKNKEGEDMVQLVGHNPHGWRKHQDKLKLCNKWAEYGYSLAEQQLSDQSKEIERLKGLIEYTYKCLFDSTTLTEDDWQQFKTENNL